MILEIAQIDVKPGMETEFEAGVKKAAPIFKRANLPGSKLRSFATRNGHNLHLSCDFGI